jgi:hypothetical protein
MKRKFELNETNIRAAIAFYLNHTETLPADTMVDSMHVELTAHPEVQDGPHYNAGFISAEAEATKVER